MLRVSLGLARDCISLVLLSTTGFQVCGLLFAQQPYIPYAVYRVITYPKSWILDEVNCVVAKRKFFNNAIASTNISKSEL